MTERNTTTKGGTKGRAGGGKPDDDHIDPKDLHPDDLTLDAGQVREILARMCDLNERDRLDLLLLLRVIAYEDDADVRQDLYEAAEQYISGYLVTVGAAIGRALRRRQRMCTQEGGKR